MAPEREREYAELHAFVDFYSTSVEGIDPSDPCHPTNVGHDIVREYGRSKALEGLRQAVHDIVEDVGDMAPADVTRLDGVFAEAGHLTISEARRRYASAYKRLLKRRAIKSEKEYYLVIGVLSDVDSLVPGEEREALEAMVVAFNENTKGSKRGS